MKNGWKDFNELTCVVLQKEYPYEKGEEYLLNKCKSYIDTGLYPIIIFNKDFARAFWKDDKISQVQIPCPDGIVGCAVYHCEIKEIWKEHLQKMVIEADPLEYLNQFI